MNTSTRGTRTLQTSCDPSSEPIVNSEKDAGATVSYSASAAAIFIGRWAQLTFGLNWA